MALNTKTQFIAQRYMPGSRYAAALWIDMHEQPFDTIKQAVAWIDTVRENGSQGVIKNARVVGIVGEWEFD